MAWGGVRAWQAAGGDGEGEGVVGRLNTSIFIDNGRKPWLLGKFGEMNEGAMREQRKAVNELLDSVQNE